jgi:hypothetical protein
VVMSNLCLAVQFSGPTLSTQLRWA